MADGWHTVEIRAGVFRIDAADGNTVGEIRRTEGGIWRVTMHIVDIQCEAIDFARALYFVEGVEKTLAALRRNPHDAIAMLRGDPS